MATKPPQIEAVPDTASDLRWQLVERIVASPSFAKSERLSSFLVCVCDLARRGEQEQINEQYIGTKVFGRRPNYDAGADSIVRSHASRLRHRLSQYFAEEGAREQWVLTIPKGSYLPVFHLREGAMEPVTEDDPEEEAGMKAAVSLLDGVPTLLPPAVVQATPVAVPSGAKRSNYLVPLLSAGLVLTTLVAFICAVALVWGRRDLPEVSSAAAESKQLFWGHLFSPKEQTLVVNADSGLVMLQGLTKRRVTLPMYLNGSYLENLPPTPIPTAQVLDLASRRYTSAVDLTIMSKILRLTGVSLTNTRFVYSRDIRPRDIKQGNLILLGTYESTPWVQLFEPGMNFYFQNNLAGGVFSVINRNPRPGEQPAYDARADDPDHTVYGVIGYVPTLNGSGKVLILEGQSMAGTETAADFVFDDGYLLPFLRSNRKQDGTIPYFELLLRSRSISGEASRLDVVAARVQDR